MKKYFCILTLIAFIAVSFSGCGSKPAAGPSNDVSKDLRGDGLAVLCYHRVMPANLLKIERNLDPMESELAYYTIDKDKFISQLKYLKNNNVKFLTPKEADEYLSKKQAFSGKLALVTLDDGDLSIYKQAYPVLVKMKIPFILFMIAGEADKQWEGFHMCSWDQLKKMEASGYCTVGLHTYDMHYIDAATNKPALLNKENKKRFEKDTKEGIASLKKHLGTGTVYYAYPYGFGNPDTDNILLSNGINDIFSLSSKINHPGDKKFFIGRYLVTEDNWNKIAAWVKQK